MRLSSFGRKGSCVDLMRLVKPLTFAAALLAISVPSAASAQSTADLSVSIVGSPDPVRTNASLTWTITVTNLGPAQASGVQLVFPLGSDGQPFSATTTQGTCAPNSDRGSFDFSLGSIAPGGQVTATVVVQVFGGDSHFQGVSAASTTEDPNQRNNSARGSVSIGGTAPFRELSGVFCPPIGGVATGGGGTADGSQAWLMTVLLAVGLLASATLLVRR
jgi:uncharacterized repeat protein (TIGR01451 family)